MARNADLRELRTLLVLLATAVGLLTAGAVVFVTFAYPRLAEPLAASAAVLTCLAGFVRLIVNGAGDRR
ncbi:MULTISPECIES: hypothetical protein [unclassified Streptomyces]|uniref:hypothetical protein n=1 Tax=unclassified Streptomyces TaxID=2593676 RepID=UPI003656C70E|nr:hypothetical protein OG844_34115 [Streptomyces sp. NBC_00887]